MTTERTDEPQYRIVIDHEMLAEVLEQYILVTGNLRVKRAHWWQIFYLFATQVLGRMTLTDKMGMWPEYMWGGLTNASVQDRPSIGEVVVDFRSATLSFWGHQIGVLREIEDDMSFDPGDVSHEYPAG